MPMEWPTVIVAVLFAVAGLLVGGLYLLLLWLFVEQLSPEKRGFGRLAGLTVLRVLIFGGALVLAILAGIWAMLSYLAGFLVARALAVRLAKPRGTEGGGQNG